MSVMTSEKEKLLLLLRLRTLFKQQQQSKGNFFASSKASEFWIFIFLKKEIGVSTDRKMMMMMMMILWMCGMTTKNEYKNCCLFQFIFMVKIFSLHLLKCKLPIPRVKKKCWRKKRRKKFCGKFLFMMIFLRG